MKFDLSPPGRRNEIVNTARTYERCRKIASDFLEEVLSRRVKGGCPAPWREDYDVLKRNQIAALTLLADRLHLGEEVLIDGILYGRIPDVNGRIWRVALSELSDWGKPA